MTDPTPFTIEEDIPSGGLRVQFVDSDMPQGKPRDFPGFNSGGELMRELIRLPGRTTPIVQVQQAAFRPMVLKGAFRDHLFIGDGGTAGAAHARGMRDQVEQLRVRANPLRITWAGESRIGLLVESDFGEESEQQITYELTFEILRPVQATSDPGKRNQRQDTADLSAQMRAMLAARRAELVAIATTATRAAMISRILAAVDLADAALATTLSAAIVMERAPAPGIQAAATRAVGAAGGARDACRAANELIRALSPIDVVPFGDVTASASWTLVQFSLCVSLAAILDQLRTISASARSRLRAAVRLYTVRPGDTLESIARLMLGDASRGSEFGVRPDQLTPGLVLRVPTSQAA